MINLFYVVVNMSVRNKNIEIAIVVVVDKAENDRDVRALGDAIEAAFPVFRQAARALGRKPEVEVVVLVEGFDRLRHR